MTWQPIETAPKTGSGKRLGRECGPEIILSDGNAIYFGFWNGRAWDDGDYHDDLGIMLFWQPMPELPVIPSPSDNAKP